MMVSSPLTGVKVVWAAGLDGGHHVRAVGAERHHLERLAPADAADQVAYVEGHARAADEGDALVVVAADGPVSVPLASSACSLTARALLVNGGPAPASKALPLPTALLVKVTRTLVGVVALILT
jgi:hypothetical protein